jgi:hypothetical protein
MPARIIIITNPAHDKATKYLHAWSDGTLASIQNLPDNTSIYELKKGEVTKEKLTELVEDKDPHLILFHGHGGSNKILGFETHILVSHESNEELLKNRIIHSLSCNSGEVLGPKCVILGTKAYIGYKEEFKFAHYGKTRRSSQFKDPVASLFLKPAFEINKALLEGNTVQQAYKRSQKIYSDTLQMLLTSNNPDLNTIYASRVYHNMIHQVALGDQTSSF